eukprot:238779_1
MGDSLKTIDLGTNFIPIQIFAGALHTCAFSQGKTVKCWGDNALGQLGQGDIEIRGDEAGEMGDSLPTIDLGTNFIPAQISVGQYHNSALSQNSAIKCWGRNDFGRLGYGDSNHRGDEAGEMGDSLNTTNLGTNFIPIQISAGQRHTCALSQGNTTKCWGANHQGQLGYGDKAARGDQAGQMGDNLNTIELGTNFIPTQILAGPNYHTCAFSQSKTAKCFGDNSQGQLGYGDNNNRGDGPGEMGDALKVIHLMATAAPTAGPSKYPTTSPSKYPTASPSKYPTTSPSKYPTTSPSKYPTASPSKNPTDSPSKYPTASPSKDPTTSPSKYHSYHRSIQISHDKSIEVSYHKPIQISHDKSIEISHGKSIQKSHCKSIEISYCSSIEIPHCKSFQISHGSSICTSIQISKLGTKRSSNWITNTTIQCTKRVSIGISKR